MKLTPEQQAVLDGSKGAVMAKVMKTLVMYGDAFGAEKMVPVTSTYGHTVISFGINAMKPVYDLYDQLIEAGAFSEQKFTADPLPLDKNVPSNPLQDLVFHQFMYKQQARYEAQLRNKHEFQKMSKKFGKVRPSGKNTKTKRTEYSLCACGRGSKSRTHGTRFWRPLLYQLSYTPIYLSHSLNA